MPEFHFLTGTVSARATVLQIQFCKGTRSYRLSGPRLPGRPATRVVMFSTRRLGDLPQADASPRRPHNPRVRLTEANPATNLQPGLIRHSSDIRELHTGPVEGLIAALYPSSLASLREPSTHRGDRALRSRGCWVCWRDTSNEGDHRHHAKTTVSNHGAWRVPPRRSLRRVLGGTREAGPACCPKTVGAPTVRKPRQDLPPHAAKRAD